MRPALVVLTALLLLTACSKEEPKPIPGTEVPSGFHRIGGTATGLSIGVPTSWKSADFSKPDGEAQMNATGLTGEALERARKTLRALISTKAVYAVDLASQQESPAGLVTNLSGLCAPSVGASDDALIAAAKKEIAAYDAKIVDARPVTMGTVRGVRIRYTAEMYGTQSQGTQYYIPSPKGTTCVVTLTTDLPGKEGLFEQIGATIRLL
ncbi:hypothetical protein [Herbidospora sp. RD11066]